MDREAPHRNHADTAADAAARPYGPDRRAAERTERYLAVLAQIVDDGAATALRKGKSLLPAGGVAIEGTFERGDCIVVRTKAGSEAGRGLSAYASSDIHRIAGHKSGEIAAILGYRGRDEIIHRDDLVLTELT